jgi:hypothetical protein
MACKPYMVSVRINQERFIVEIKLSPSDYDDFHDGDSSAIDYVLDMIYRMEPRLAGRDFDEQNVSFDV